MRCAMLVLVVVLSVAAAVPGSSYGATPVRSGTGTLLVVNVVFHGSRPDSQVLALHSGADRVLVHTRHADIGLLSLSPDGLHDAFVDFSIPRAGIWAINRDGANLHRIEEIPRSPCDNPLSVGSLAWSPNGRQLAYSVFIPSDAIHGCPIGARDATGVWVTSYDHPQPRQLDLNTDPQTVEPLSWSPDGTTIAANHGGSIFAIDVASGKARMLVRQGRQGMFAPMTGALAYITEGQGSQKPALLWVAGTKGRHRHVLTSLTQGVPSEDVLTWSPDGRSIAYITDTGRTTRPGVSEKGTRTLWVAGAVAHRPKPLVFAPDGVLLSPGWSRDGGRIAYLATAACLCRGAANRRVDVAVSVVDVHTGAHRLILHPAQRGMHVLKGSHFDAVVWVKT